MTCIEPQRISDEIQRARGTLKTQTQDCMPHVVCRSSDLSYQGQSWFQKFLRYKASEHLFIKEIHISEQAKHMYK